MRNLLSESYDKFNELIKQSLTVLITYIMDIPKTKNNKGSIEESGFALNENMIQSFILSLIPKDKDLHFSKEFRCGNGISDILCYSFKTNRLILIEVKCNKNAKEGFDQTEKYCESLKIRNPHIKEILRLSIDYSYEEDAEKDKKTETISYMYALQKYNQENPLDFSMEGPKEDKIDVTALLHKNSKGNANVSQSG